MPFSKTAKISFQGEPHIMINEYEGSNLNGLTEQEVAERIASDGYNELPGSKKRRWFSILFEVVREPMFLLLIVCGALYLILGDKEEAIMLMGFVVVIIGITLYQEQKTERALEALRDLTSPRALVIRDGLQERIAGREVVRDDIVLVAEGDRVPADAVLLSAINLNVDESLLTGESVPVRKRKWDGVRQIDRPGGEDQPFIYSGTMVVKGQGIARVVSTGPRTEIGKIGKALQTLGTEETTLQRQTSSIVKKFALIGFSLCILVVVVYGMTRGNWLHGLLAGITLAMATLPEEFPVVLTIFLALGAWRISQRNVLTRRVPAVEMLGAATVLCVDKTGTLTQNRMTVTKLAVDTDIYNVGCNELSLPEQFHEVVEYSILASPTDPFDPMEKAMKDLGMTTLGYTEHIHRDWMLIREYPISEKLLAMSRVWKSTGTDDYLIAAKGAPEAIADLCHMTEAGKMALNPQIDRMGSEGLRVIGVAKSRFRLEDLPPDQHDFKFEFIGLVGLSDPVRPEVPAAVQECYTAGIRVVMITGDYPVTARNIGQQIGLQPIDAVITGPELDRMSDEELSVRIKSVSIFARVVPEQKLRIVKALKSTGEVVAMTGDGVNDAPALKAAHIGIAMGGRGTDVARESSSLVLTDDNFASIVQAVRMGRRIFDNLKNAINFIFSVHIPIAGMSLLPVIFKWPLALLPAHILFLELIIDPACSVVFEMESEEKDIMKRPPRRVEEPLFGRSMIISGLIQGLGLLAVVLAIYGLVLSWGFGESEARMIAFSNMVIANLGLIFANRSQTRTILSTIRIPNPALWWVTGGALFFLMVAIFIPGLQRIFHFAPLHSWEFFLILISGFFSILIAESVKIRIKGKSIADL